jgi:hypothetical protein
LRKSSGKAKRRLSIPFLSPTRNCTQLLTPTASVDGCWDS